MTDHLKPGTPPVDAGFEPQDLKAAGIVYFLLTLGIVTILCMAGLRVLYAFLDKREKASQPAVSPLVTNVPEDTRHVAPGYPQSVFPSPKLEEDERGQLNGIKLQQDDVLYTYGWVDQQAGTMRIPIDRAMDLLVQRGLPVRTQSGSADSGIDTANNNQATAPATGASKGKKK